jgi:serine/threonine protein kinase
VRHYSYANSTFSSFVAVKLLPVATASLQIQNEVTILELVQEKAVKAPSGSEHIRKYLRQFTERRDHRAYHGIVMEATGQSIQSKLIREPIPFAEAKEIVRSIIRGLRFLHHECKVAHGG